MADDWVPAWTYKHIRTESDKLLIGYQKIMNLIERKVLSIRFDDSGRKMVSVQEVVLYLERERMILENYITIRTFLNQLNGEHQHNQGPTKKGLKQLAQDGKLELVEFNGLIYIPKSFLLDLQTNYFRRVEAMKSLGLKQWKYDSLIKLHAIQEIKLTSATVFVQKDIIEKADRYRKYISINALYTSSRYKHLRRSEGAILKLSEYGHIYILNNSGTPRIDLESLEKYSSFEEQIISNNYTFSEVSKLLGVPELSSEAKKQILKLGNDGLFRVTQLKIKVKSNFYYINKQDFDRFLSDYILHEMVLINFNIKFPQLRDALSSGELDMVEITRKLKYYPLVQIRGVEERINEQLNSFDLNLYYTKTESMQILNLTPKTYQSFIKEEDVHTKQVYRNVYFLKSDIDELRRKQLEVFNNYYEIAQLPDGIEGAIYRNPVARTFRKSLSTLESAVFSSPKIRYVYEKKATDEFIQSFVSRMELRTSLAQIDVRNATIAFKQVLNINEIYFSKDTPETEKEWLNYCYSRLYRSESSEQTMDITIRRLGRCTQIVIEALKSSEIYSLTANEINLAMFNHNISNGIQRDIYMFLKRSTEVNKFTKKVKYRINRITNPFAKKKVSEEKTIYQYEEYKKLFDHLNNLTFHKPRAIMDAKAMLEGTKTTKYATSWLYMMMHLNNAWRHSDVVQLLPCINIEEIGLYDLQDIEEHDILIEEAQTIINQIIRKDLKVSKNGAMANFFCSEELSITFATAVIICECIRRKLHPTRSHIIDFNTKKQKLADSNEKMVLGQLSNSIKFESRKMNRSLLSYLYILLVRRGKGSAALEIAQRLRSHEDFESTNIYIHIPPEELDHLTRQLFARGHFGYIPYLLTEVIMGQTEDRELRTAEMTEVSQLFAGVHGIEVSAAFLNAVQQEKENVANRILKMSVDEASDFMFDLNANLLPSKEKNYSCFVSREGCHYPGRNCSNCYLSISNFYTLSSLAASIKQTVMNLKLNMESIHYKAEKTRFSNLLFIHLDKLDEAIKRFGKNEVFKFFEDGIDGFNELVLKVDEVNSEDNLVALSTYLTSK